MIEYEFTGYCSMIDDCCKLCKEHNCECDTCPNECAKSCHYADIIGKPLYDKVLD